MAGELEHPTGSVRNERYWQLVRLVWDLHISGTDIYTITDTLRDALGVPVTAQWVVELLGQGLLIAQVQQLPDPHTVAVARLERLLRALGARIRCGDPKAIAAARGLVSDILSARERQAELSAAQPDTTEALPDDIRRLIESVQQGDAEGVE